METVSMLDYIKGQNEMAEALVNVFIQFNEGKLAEKFAKAQILAIVKAGAMNVYRPDGETDLRECDPQDLIDYVEGVLAGNDWKAAPNLSLMSSGCLGAQLVDDTIWYEVARKYC